MAKNGREIFSFWNLCVSVWLASGILLLTASVTPAQTLETATAPAPAAPGTISTANPAAAPGDDDGESSPSLEFISPVRAVTTAPRVTTSGGSPIVNPASNTLSGGTVHMPTRNAAITLDAPQTRTALPTAAKAGVCVLFIVGLLALGTAGARAMTQDRARERSMEA